MILHVIFLIFIPDDVVIEFFLVLTTQVCNAIGEVAKRLVGKDAEELFSDMGRTWDYMMADSQLRW